MQNMASSPFYLLPVVSTNLLSSNAKPVSLLDNGEYQWIINLLPIQNDIPIKFPNLLDYLKNRLMECAIVWIAYAYF